MMEIDRRRFLGASAALFTAWGLPFPLSAQAREARLFLSACSDASGQTLTRVIAEAGRKIN